MKTTIAKGVCRGAGYLALMCCGIGMAHKDGLLVFMAELFVGHLLICAAEVLGKK